MIKHRPEQIRPDPFSLRVSRKLRAFNARLKDRLGFAGPGVEGVSISQTFRHPIDRSQRPGTTSLYRDLFSDAVRAEIAEAERLLAHRFTLLGHTWDHGERIGWFIDPVSRLEWDSGFSPGIPFRGPGRLGDIKLPWELNKHQYFFTLGKATWLTHDPRFALEIIQQIDDWLKENPFLRGINWIDALQVGTRAISWIAAYPFYADYCSEPFRRRLSESLAQHIIFVEEHLSRGRFANNHLIGEAAALVMGGLFLDSPWSGHWIEKGLGLLDQEMGRQVAPDGVHREGSIAYHRFCLDHYQLVNAFLAANGRSFGRKTCQGMERMTEFLMDVLFPDRSAPAFSDSDDARGLWFRSDCPAEYRSLLALGAVLFRRGDFKETSGSVTEEVLWLYGKEGVAEYQELPEVSPDHTSVAYPEGGYYVMRGGWNSSSPMLVFDCGPLGFGSAGHGHADALGFQFFASHYPFFIDPGTYSYNLDYEWRDVFRSSPAHNVVVIDSLNQSVPRDRMSWEFAARAYPRQWVTNPQFDLVDGHHDGYCRLSKPVTHRRIIAFLKPDVWWLYDHIVGDGDHTLECLLHLRPDCQYERRPDGQGMVFQSPGGAKVYTLLNYTNLRASTFEVVTESNDRPWASFSSHYGAKVPARVFMIKGEFEGHCTLATCFSTSSQVAPTLAYENEVARMGLIKGTGKTDVICYSLAGESPMEEPGFSFLGKLLYRRESEETVVLRAHSFRQLSVKGQIKISSSVSVDSIVLQEDQCLVTCVPDCKPEVSAREGVRVFINGIPFDG